MPPPVEISIPSTSILYEDSKPYTSYNITLRLPLQSFVVQKRYSEFEQLHRTLVSLVGSPPPATLPAKSWFRSTVSSPELTERRRAELEQYLRAIAGSPDRQWRDTPAWRQFLNLPASTAGSAASASGIHAASGRGLQHVAGNSQPDPAEWIEKHRRMNDALRDARSCLARRDAAAADGSSSGGGGNRAVVEAAAAARMALTQAIKILAALEEELGYLKKAGRLGAGELRRRDDMLKEARDDHRWLVELSSSVSGPGASSSAAATAGGPPAATDRAALVGTGGSRAGAGRPSGRVLGAPLQETERTRELDNAGVVQLQRQQMDEQSEDVDVLSRIVKRQKEMSLAIWDEVETQTQMLDQLGDDVDRLDGKIKVAKNRTKKLGS
ncbi:hypothetical protein RB595_008217 [Gaeumannomyces hyphopodioides]